MVDGGREGLEDGGGCLVSLSTLPGGKDMGLAGFECATGPMSPVSLLLRRITWGERPGERR